MIQYTKLMTHTVKVRKRARNKSGDFSDISSSTMKGFCQYGNHYYTDDKGEKKPDGGECQADGHPVLKA